MSLPEIAVRRPIGVGVIMVAIGVTGAIAVGRLPVQLLPALALPQLVIHVAYPNASPVEVEQSITERVEAAVAGMPGLESISSRSMEGVGLIRLVFAWGLDMDFAMIEVRERLDRVAESLPDRAARPNIMLADPAQEPVVSIAVGGGLELSQVRELANDVFRRRLEQLDGVARAHVNGGLEREVRVHLSAARMEAYGIGTSEVERAIGAANVSAQGGTIARAQLNLPLRTFGELVNAAELADVIVPAGTWPDAAGSVVRIRDIGRVTDGYAPREAMTFLDGSEAVGLEIFPDHGANTVRVARAVQEVVRELADEYPGVRLTVVHSQAAFISEALTQVRQALLLGALLSFVVLFVFLGDPRYPLLVAAAIPLSLAGTFFLLDVLDISLNLLSMGGLALGVGMLVDNSIVVLENIVRHLEAGADRCSAAARGATEVQRAITASTLTSIAVFVPIAHIEGVAGALFRDLAVAVACSLAVSLLVALALLPALAARFQPGQRMMRRGRKLDQVHGRSFAFVMQRRGAVLGAVVLVCAGGVGLAASLPRVLIAPVDEGTLDVLVRLPPGTPIEVTAIEALKIDSVAREDPDVEAVLSQVGRGKPSWVVNSPVRGGNEALLRLRLRPEAGAETVAERLRGYTRDVEGNAEIGIRSGRTSALGLLLGFEGADIEVLLGGGDAALLRNDLQAVTSVLASLPMLANVLVDAPYDLPRVRIEVSPERAQARGLEPGTVARAMEQALQGVKVADLVEFDRRIPVVLSVVHGEDLTFEALPGYRIAGVPLREFAEVIEGTEPVEIRREDRVRVASVRADVVRGGLDRAVRAVEAALAGVRLEAGSRLSVSGARRGLGRSFGSLGLAFLLALAVVYLILAAQFESLVQPLLVLGAVPPAVTGALIALAWGGYGLDVMGLIGIVVLVGVVVNDAIVKVDFVQAQRRAGVALDQAVRHAARARVRPVIMTTVTTIPGLLPMALGLGAASALRKPLALALIGGLVVGTLYTLFAIPALQLLLEGHATSRGSIRQRGASAREVL